MCCASSPAAANHLARHSSISAVLAAHTAEANQRYILRNIQVPAGWGCGAMLVVHAGNYRIGGSDKSVSCLLPTTKTMADVTYHVSAYIPILKDLT
ncbi:hypothetical protein BDBG_09106 [Blastomyces gilchristii SLH14081]|uniref:Uncharacterized protein n=1 Tax=Blastomyces gilchristii (strain SLH14081) TaxID=559298 RepID=A0A179V103_BLAGS|nr:uncharacterized protein BDBG_09106 [Blastomyces gilchristii SLH14081]OAT14014.1 hypothetical protein BDBG_09106 [Blastomyces gilchristii SLH14081]